MVEKRSDTQSGPNHGVNLTETSTDPSLLLKDFKALHRKIEGIEKSGRFLEEKSTSAGLAHARAAVMSSSDLFQDSRFGKIGKGMNKSVFVLRKDARENRSLEEESFGWVVYVLTAGSGNSKWRDQQAEVSQLQKLEEEGVTVPKIDPVIVHTRAEGRPARAFFPRSTHNYSRKR